MSKLFELHCVPVNKDNPALSADDILDLNFKIPEWKVHKSEGIPRLERVFKFNDFRHALEFTNKIGMLAEEEDHHPAILTEWGKVTITWWTHVIKGLHMNDFIMAAKTDVLFTTK
jgi:4a-hydroxytetrahydrobiopterin dehydratase